MEKSKSLAVAVAIVCTCLLIVGCAKDPRPKYVRPDLPKGEYVAIAPTVGAFSGSKTEVDEVDGARIAGFLESYDVRVSPGEHVIGVVVRASDHVHGLYRFRYDFARGHAYEVGIDSKGSRASLRPLLRDKTLNQTFFIDEPPLSVPREWKRSSAG